MKKLTGKILLLLGLGTVLVGGLYLNSSQKGEEKEPFFKMFGQDDNEPRGYGTLSPTEKSEKKRAQLTRAMKERVLDNFDPETRFFLTFQGKAYPILPAALDSSEVLRTAAMLAEEENGKVELDLQKTFFDKIKWTNVKPKDIELSVRLLNQAVQTDPQKKDDFINLKQESMEQLSRLIMLADFFGAKTELFEKLIGTFAEKIKPELTNENIADFLEGKENIISKIIDEFTKGPLRILKEKLFQKQDIDYKILDLPSSSKNLVKLSDKKIAAIFLDDEHKIGIWDATTGQQLKTLNIPGSVKSFAKLSDEKIAVKTEIDDDDYTVANIVIWNTTTDKQLKVLDLQNWPEKFYALSDKTIAIKFEDDDVPKIGIWDVTTNKELNVLDIPGSFKKLTRLSDKTIAIKFEDDDIPKVGIWNDATTNKELNVLDIPVFVLGLTRFSDKTIAIEFDDDDDDGPKVGIWDIATNEELGVLDIPGSAFQLAGLLKEKLVVRFHLGRGEQRVGIFDEPTNKQIQRLNVPGYVVKFAKLSDRIIAVEFRSRENRRTMKWKIFDILPLYDIFSDLTFKQSILAKYLEDTKGVIPSKVVQGERYKEILTSLPEKEKKLFKDLDLIKKRKKGAL